MRCLFAKGKESERAFSSGVVAGSHIIPVTDANQYFQPGDFIFASNASGQNVEFLGPATSVNTGEISCFYPHGMDRPAGSLCWKPEHRFMFSKKRTRPERSLQTGISTRRSLGGQAYLTKIREQTERETLQLEKVRKVEADEFREWINNALAGGIETFTFCDERRNISTAILLTTEIKETENAPEEVSIEVEIEL